MYAVTRYRARYDTADRAKPQLINNRRNYLTQAFHRRIPMTCTL